MKRSVDYPTYEGKYDEGIKNMMAKNPNQIDEETMRANLYGYTYTEEYAKGEIPNEFSMDYWKELFFEGVFPLEEMGICMDFENRPDFDDEDSSIYDDNSIFHFGKSFSVNKSSCLVCKRTMNRYHIAS